MKNRKTNSLNLLAGAPLARKLATAFGLAVTLVVGIVLSGSVHADGDDFEDAIKARKGAMQLYGFNVGVLAAMAKGEVEYDGAKAQTAADNLVTLMSLSAGAMYPAGSGNDNADDTRALPDIWEDLEGYQGKGQAMFEAVTALQEEAGLDLDSLRGAMGAVGDACKGCHKGYRAKKK